MNYSVVCALDTRCRTGMSGRVREVREGERRREERRDGGTVGKGRMRLQSEGREVGMSIRKRRGDEHQDEGEEEGTRISTTFPDTYLFPLMHSSTDSKSKRKWRRSEFSDLFIICFLSW